MNEDKSALAGVRVLDMTRVLAGPWATQILGDFGAEVIKIEKPHEGDETRGWGPPFVPDAEGKAGDAAYFFTANRNKRSVAVDFTKPEGAALIRTMAARADVFAENYRTGGLAKYGLDYPSLKAINPRLVYCSVTGFGQTGPYAKRAGYDYLIQAMGGLMSITGQQDGTPGAEPLKVGVAVADLFAGMYAATGILAALRHAERTGEGQHVDVALLDGQVAMLANQTMNYLATGTAPTRLGNAHPNIAPYQVFAAADGHIVLAVGNDGQFAAFCREAGLDDLPADPRFAANPARVANRQALIDRIAPVFAARTSAEWFAALDRAGVACGPINTIDQVFADPQVIARGMRQTRVRADGVEAPLVANPIKMSETAPRIASAPPLLGGDTEAVLHELGLSEADIAALRAAGALG